MDIDDETKLGMHYFVDQKGSNSEFHTNPDKLEKVLIQYFNRKKNESPVDNIVLLGNSGSGKSMFLRIF